MRSSILKVVIALTLLLGWLAVQPMLSETLVVTSLAGYQGSNNGSILQVDTSTNTITTILSIGGNPDSVVFAPNNTLIFSLPNQSGIGVYNTVTQDLNYFHGNLFQPLDLALDPSGTSVLVADSGNSNGPAGLKRIDLTQQFPIPTIVASGFGDIDGRLLVLGLAPAAHGGNRTGRVFTGDSSGRFLVRALHKAGFANQPISERIEDGLVYSDCYVTAAVKCAPPGDRPTPQEFANCARFLDAEIGLMRNLQAVLALGSLAFTAYMGYLRRHHADAGRAIFKHGSVHRFPQGPSLWASYHPSPRNTNTGKLTMEMLVGVLEKIRASLDQ